MDDLDQNPLLVNVLNGTLDVRSGNLQPHRRDDLITKLIPIRYDPTASAPRWYQFLAEIFDGDLELCKYVQRLVGYSLTGDQREKLFVFLWGPTDTGKTTFAETILRLAGDYGQQAPASLFLREHDGNIPTDEARLRGVRLAIASETGEGRHFDEEKLKKLTGRDRIVARFMRKDFFEFSPTHHLWLLSNYRPHAKSDDTALWSRLKLIPFIVQFDDAAENPNTLRPMDRGLPEKLVAELPGILAWAIEGAHRWYNDGLNEPAKVRAATAEYRTKEDVLAAFIRENLEEVPGATVKQSVLFKLYEQWTDNRRRLGKHHFNTALRDIYGFKEKPTAGGQVWLDRKLAEGADQPMLEHHPDKGGNTRFCKRSTN